MCRTATELLLKYRLLSNYYFRAGMEQLIGIFTTRPHPRINYVATMLSHWWGVRVSVNPEPETASATIHYGQAGAGIQLPMHPIMQAEEVPGYESLELNTTFPWSEDFDPLAAIFFCLSRYEEYQDFQADRHLRFPATASIAYQQGWLREPMAVRWADQLYQDLRKYQSSLPPLTREFVLLPTYDIDIAWAYRERGWRGWLRMAMDLFGGYFKRVSERLGVMLSNKRDPYDVFDRLEETHQANGLKAQYFWLLAKKRSRLNPNVSPNSRRLAQLIGKVASREENTLGIHPSYHSATQSGLFAEEIGLLQSILLQPIKHSRQHFLRFNTPETFRDLIDNGVQHEHSMAYADTHGWRAGTHLPFYWYDLLREETTSLMIHPFPVMDATLRHYLGLSPDEGRKVLDFYRQQIEELGGPLQLLWHNSSFSHSHGWGAYGEMYLDFLREAGNAGSTD